MSLIVNQNERVLHIVLNRPAKRNALSFGMCSAINEAVRQAQDRKDIGAILISAAGAVFCAGMDLEEAAHSEGSKLTAVHEELFSMGAQARKPIVMAVNGAALGGGLGLAAQGHVVLAAEQATFGLPEIRVGLWPFLVYRSVEAAIGARRTLELSLTGRTFSAQVACEWGLVQRTIPAAELEEAAEAVAREAGGASPHAVERGMRYARESAGLAWSEAGKLAAALRDQVMSGEDFQEGFAAFKERRRPRWPSMPEGFQAEQSKDREQP